MSVKIFCHKELESLFLQHGMDLTRLKMDFAQYKDHNKPASNFGRDAKYNHPNGLPIVREEKVAHLHLEDPNSPWKKQSFQFNKTSDIHLIYCQGFYNEDYYLLMALLSPDAHEQALDNNIMYNLGLMAKKFRVLY